MANGSGLQWQAWQSGNHTEGTSHGEREGEQETRQAGGEIRCILAVDDDRRVDDFTSMMHRSGFEVVWLRPGARSADAGQRSLVDVLLVDRDLPDHSRRALLRTVRPQEPPVLDPHGGGAQTGGRDGRPAAPRANTAEEPRTVADRWAAFVMHVVRSPHDLKTMDAWAKSAGASRSALCECCRLVHLVPRSARDFSRVLRVVCSSRRQWEPEAELDIADARTLAKLLGRSGLADWPRALRPTPLQYLARQQWIPRDNPGLLALQALLVDRDAPGAWRLPDHASIA